MQVRLVVVGAASELARRLMWLLAEGDVFGLDHQIYIHLLDDQQKMAVLREISNELSASDLPLLRGVLITSSQSEAFDDNDVTFLPRNQKPSMMLM